jgi:AAA+ superfamily predicted ATPase
LDISAIDDMLQATITCPSSAMQSETDLLRALAYVDVLVRWAVVRARSSGLNPHDEFRGLYITDSEVDDLFQLSLGEHIWSRMPPERDAESTKWRGLIQAARESWQREIASGSEGSIDSKSRLKMLIHNFNLTLEETEILLLAVAPEIDPRYGQIYGYLQNDVTRKTLSVGLVFNLITANFSDKLRLFRLLGPNGQLIRHKLVALRPETLFLQSSVLVPFHLVRFLLEDDALDSQLVAYAGFFEHGEITPGDLTDEFLAKLVFLHEEKRPLFAFSGPPGAGKLNTARHLATVSNQKLLVIDLAAMKASGFEVQNGLGLALRDGRLHQAILYLKDWHIVLDNGRVPKLILSTLLDYPHTVIVVSDVVWSRGCYDHPRPIFPVCFQVPDFQQRLCLWQKRVGHQSELDLDAVANQFRFTVGQIEDALAAARDLAQWEGSPLQTYHIFAACRAQSNQNLAQLAIKIKPRYTWDDIILPGDTKIQLQEMVNMVRARPIVYQVWGFGRKLALGKGLSALFAGESGTGKTMAADIMAHKLGLDLYKVDLATLVSKYIGETEKNLDRIFSEAATSNAILFFDEADAIFGKRSEVKDSHDRYANIEVSYLLQRMEAYEGVVILATNLRANMDEAFTRRLHFAIEFPFPEATDREHIWRVNFPPETPIAADVDWALLAHRFQLTGGNIRNIILAAAFLAAEKEEPVGMAHLLHAARREYQKMGRLIDESLFR